MLKKVAALAMSVVVSTGMLAAVGPAPAHATHGPYVRVYDYQDKRLERRMRPNVIELEPIYDRTWGAADYLWPALVNVNWSSWTNDAAYGRGLYVGVGDTEEPVKVKLYDAHTHDSGKRYFRKMRLIFPYSGDDREYLRVNH